jgi:predicted secreted Zn-dependent protease
LRAVPPASSCTEIHAQARRITDDLMQQSDRRQKAFDERDRQAAR